MDDVDYQAHHYVTNKVKTENLQLSEPNKEKAVVNDEDSPKYRKIDTHEYVRDMFAEVLQIFFHLEYL